MTSYIITHRKLDSTNNINFVQKREYIYTKENDFEIKKLVQDNFSFEAFKNRDEELKLRIKNFVQGSL